MVKGDGSDLHEFLAERTVLLVGSDDLDRQPFHLAGFLLLVNLCARLYPRIAIVGPSPVVDECRRIALQINPACELYDGLPPTKPDGTISWACTSSRSQSITVAPNGWEVLIDVAGSREVEPTNMLTALAAGAIAASELFRCVFSDFLPKGRPRGQAEPGRFNVLTNAPTNAAPPQLPSDIALGRVHLVGAGAIGQAAAYALSRVSVTGTIVIVDAESVSLSNLQRYLLTTDSDVGIGKTELVARALKNTRLETITVPSEWNTDFAETRAAEVICAAVDSESVRIELQAGLPRRIYNAWTQPADIGWSRHEYFGAEPCTACLYWPTGQRPSYHEQVARALRQHELRILAYLIHNLPVDMPLPATQVPRIQQYPLPEEAANWSQRSLLADVALTLEKDVEELAVWKGQHLSALYRDGICAGAIVRNQAAEVPAEMAVPLAHQSALAGIMLALQLIAAARPELREHRSRATESRLDLMSGFPQISSRPRQKSPHCICSDPDFVTHYESKWPYRGW